MKLAPILLLTLAFLLQGCRALSPDGVYKGDQITYNAELTITTSYDFIRTYVVWEKENRVALAKWPEIRKSADNIRLNANKWFSSANAVLDAYKANPTSDNADALKAALAVIRSALVEATKYMAQAAQ